MLRPQEVEMKSVSGGCRGAKLPTLAPVTVAPLAGVCSLVAGLPVPFVAVRDKDGWYPISDTQTVEQLSEYFQGSGAVNVGKRQKRVYCEDEAWATGGDRGGVARLLFEAGFGAKAHRFWKCHREGIPVDCSRDSTHKFFVSYLCGCRFCRECAPILQRQLSARYLGPVISVVKAKATRPQYTLARVNFSVRSTGEVFTAKRVKWFNGCIRKLFRRLFPKGEYGLLWVDEVGYEKRGRRVCRKAEGLNLHAHGLYIGPRLNWHKVRDLWAEITGGEGLGVWLTFLKGWCHDPERVVRRAWGHLVKYVSKVPAETPQRIASLEIAFAGVRRVHSLGLFYKVAPPDDQLHQFQPEDPGRRCPVCGASFYWHSRPWLDMVSVEFLRAEGRRELSEVEREIGRARIFGGHSP